VLNYYAETLHRVQCLPVRSNPEGSTIRLFPRLRRLVAGLSPRRPGFNPGSVHVGFVVDKVALGQVPPPPRVLRFSPINFIPPVLHYKEKRKIKLIIFITGLHNKPQGCGTSVASAAGPITTKKGTSTINLVMQTLYSV
jgi:hypothetical protein